MAIYCKKCVYPIHAVNLDIDDEGICSACRTYDEIIKLDDQSWLKREQKLIEILENYRNITEGDYDCIVPVGGGKDSYFQAHYIKSLGFKPLLVTYYGNNYLPVGEVNLQNMARKLNCDHYIFKPSEEILIKLNKSAFYMMGDMNWHAHAGIKIIPVKSALQFKVPLFIFGETSWDISGMFSINDYSEYNKRTVLEHDMRGFLSDDFVGKEDLTKQDVSWYTLPDDKIYFENKLKGIFLGNFIKWDAYKQTNLMKKLYNWQESKEPFERTYRTISNLDDMHENGIHDYLKYIKFGYGRCSDHASKDIRMNYMTREEAIKMVRKYDHIKPQKDLKRWLDYVDMKENEFDTVADTFRSKSVWRKDENDNWAKDNIWDS
jgi:N-acetyl sugar amidotransferase